MLLNSIANNAYSVRPAVTRGAVGVPEVEGARQDAYDRAETAGGQFAASFRPTELWRNRGRYLNADGDSVELDNRLRGDGDKRGVVEEILKSRECKTCENRKYVDGSDDSSVSYQTPTRLNPSTAAAAVAAHENEHVINERKNAEKEGREIISQTVSIQYDICPECGRSYVSGGLTRTMSKGKREADEGDESVEARRAQGENNI